MFTSYVFGKTPDDLRSGALYDLLPALAFAGLVALDIFHWSGGEPPTNVQGLSYLVVSVLAFIGLLLRRRAPVLVLAILVVIYKLWGYLFFASGVQIPFSPLAVVLILTYSTGAHSRGWRVVAGIAVLVAFLASSIGEGFFRGHSTGNELVFTFVMTVAWLIGRGMQRYRDLTASLRAQALQLAQERDERARLAVAVERSRIARELHDVIAHSVSVMVVQAAAERKMLGQEQHQTRDVLEMIERTGRQALVELRRMLGVLRKTDDPLLLAPQPGLSDLDALIDQVREAGLPVNFRIEGRPVALPAGVELSAYRIVQEALTNTLRHGGQTHAEVTLHYLGDRLELEVIDDGGGSPKGTESNGGHGLIGMRERVAMLGGSLHAGPRKTGGFSITATLPLENVTT